MGAHESESHTHWFARKTMGSGTALNRAIHMLMEAQPMWIRLSEYDNMDPDPAESKIRSIGMLLVSQ